MDLSEIKTEIAKLSPTAYLATVSPQGTPDVTPVVPGWDGDTLWFSTFTSAVKSRNIAARPAVALHWQANDAGDGVELWGTASLHTDVETLERYWTGLLSYDLDDFYPDGPRSPGACFVSVEPERAVFVKQFGMAGVSRWKR